MSLFSRRARLPSTLRLAAHHPYHASDTPLLGIDFGTKHSACRIGDVLPLSYSCGGTWRQWTRRGRRRISDPRFAMGMRCATKHRNRPSWQPDLYDALDISCTARKFLVLSCRICSAGTARCRRGACISLRETRQQTLSIFGACAPEQPPSTRHGACLLQRMPPSHEDNVSLADNVAHCGRWHGSP